jgi:hypothetical protein
MDEFLNGWGGLTLLTAAVAVIVWTGSKLDRWIGRRKRRTG